MTSTPRQDLGRDLGARLAGVRGRIAKAARAAGRDPGDVTLVAVAKLHPAAAVAAARDAGVTDIGENYAQELDAKAAEVDGVRWHLVGRLQRNKAGLAVAHEALVHSLDSLPLAEALGRRAVAAGTTAEALVQVELADRPAAHGISPDQLKAFVTACREVDGLRVRGLMTMPPPTGDPERNRAVFARLAELGADLATIGVLDVRDSLRRTAGGRGEDPAGSPAARPHLSMGMSADLEVAVEEGATLVRVGTAIFGPRPDRARGVEATR